MLTADRTDTRRYVHFPSSIGNTGEVENGRINVNDAPFEPGTYRRGGALTFKAIPDTGSGHRPGKWTAVGIDNLGTPRSEFGRIFDKSGASKEGDCGDNQNLCEISENGRGNGVIINHEFRDPVPPQVNIRNQTTKKGVVCGYYTGPNPGDTESRIKPRTGGFEVNGTFKFRAFPTDAFPTTGSLSFSEIYDSQGRIRSGKGDDEREYRDICGDTVDGGTGTLTSNLYELDSWVLSGDNECRDTFNGASIQENVCILTEPILPVTINVEATFSAIKRTVTLSPTENGSITGTKNGEDIVSGNTYEGAGDFVFTATPVLPYTAGSWLVTSFATQSGEVIACEEGNGGNTCTIRDITGDITVSRTFTLVKTQVEISNFEYNDGDDIFVTSDPALPTTPATAVNEEGSVAYTGVITYSTASSTCSVEDDGTLSLISIGECTITANAPGDTTRLPNTKSITVNIVREDTQVRAAVYPSTATALDGKIKFTSGAIVSPSGYDGIITYSTDSDISICELHTTNAIATAIGSPFTDQENFSQSITSHNGKLYMIGLSNTLYELNPITGTTTALGGSFSETEPRSITSHGGKLYMVGHTSDTLYELNPTNGVATAIGSPFTDQENFPVSITSHGGKLYMLGSASKRLYELNTTTGEATAIGSPFSDEESLPRSITSHNGKLYMVGDEEDRLYELNTTTGEATAIGGTFTDGEFFPHSITSHNKVLYMVSKDGNVLYELNTTTGEATAVGGDFTETSPRSITSHNGKLYLVGNEVDTLYEFNITTGGITVNGAGSCEIIATASQTDRYNGSSATSTPVVISKATSSIASITHSPLIFNTDGTLGAKTTLQIRLTEGGETRDYVFGGEGERSFSFTGFNTTDPERVTCTFDDNTGVITIAGELLESDASLCNFERIVIGASDKVEEAPARNQFFAIIGSKEEIYITSFRYYVGTVDATSPPISVRSIPIVTASNTSAERLAAYYDDGGEITYESETPDVCTVNLDPSSENFLDITLISGGGARVNTKSCTIRATARSTNRFRGANNSAIIQVIKPDTTASISYAPVSYASDRTEVGITLNLTEGDNSREYDFSGNDRAITIGEVTSFDSGTTCAFNRNSGVVTITGDLPDETNPVTPACTFTITVDATPKLNGADAETVNIVANKIATSITAPVYPDTVSISDGTVSPSTEATVASNTYSGTITYSTTSDISICEVDSTNGDITTRGEGDCEVTATASGTFNHAVSASLVIVTITKEATTSTLAYPLAYRLERVTTTEPVLTIVEEGVSRTFDPNNKSRTVVFTKEENTDTEGYCDVNSETGLVTITTDVVDAVTCSVRVNIEQTPTYGEAFATFDITTSRPHYIGGETWNNEDILVTLQNNVLPVNTTYTSAGQCTVDSGGDVTVTGAGDCTITIDTQVDTLISLRISTLKGDLSITDPTYTSPILANDTAEGPTTGASTSYTYTGTITYSTSTPQICSIVEADGIVTPIAIGTCTVTATFGGDDNWNAKESNEVNITINGATNVVIFSYQQTSHVGGTQEITPTITINSQDLATTKATRTVTFAEIGDDLDANACTVNAETGVVTVTGVLPEETLNCEVGVSLGANDIYIESSDGDHNATLNLTKEQKTLTTVELSYPLAYRLERITTTTPVVNIVEGGVSRVFNQATETRTITFIEVANSDANDYCEINDSTGIVTITSDVDNEVSCVFKVLVGESDTQTSATVTTTVATSRPHYIGGQTWNNEDILITLQNNVLPPATTYTPTGQCTVDSGGDVTVTGAGDCTITIDTQVDTLISLRISTLKGDLSITDPTYTSPILANDTAEGPTTGASTSYTYTGTITYSTSTPQICSIVEADGIVTPIAIGTCTVTATFGGDDNWNAKESNEVNITINGTTGAIDFSYPKTVRKTATQEITPTITINGQDLATTKTTRTVTFAEVANSDAGGYCTVDPVTGVVTIDGDVNIAVTCSVEVSVGEGSVYAAETKIADIATARPSYDTPHTWDGTPISVILQQKDTLPSGASFSSTGQCTVDGVGDVSITGAGICTVDIDTQVDGIVSLTITTDKGDLTTTDPVYASPILANADAAGPTTEASTTAIGYDSNLITYSTSTPRICSVVEATGAVTPDLVGTCTITASFGGDVNWNAKESNPVNIDIQRATTTAALSYPSIYRLGTSATVSPVLTITEGNAAPRTFDPLNKLRIVTFSEVANSDTNNHCSVNSNTGELTIRTSNDFNDSVTCNIQVSIGQTGTYTEVTETFDITALRPNYNTSHTWANTNISIPLQNKVLAPETTYATVGQCTVDASGDVTVSGAGTCTVTIDTPTDDPIDIIIETAKGDLVLIEPVFPTEAKVNGGPILPLQVAEPAPASSGYTGLISYDQGGDGTCRIDTVTGIITPLAPGACRVIADFEGDDNWNVPDTFNIKTIQIIRATTSDPTLNYPLAYRLERVTTTEPTLTIVEEGTSRTFDPNNKSRTVVFTEVTGSDTDNYCEVHRDTGVVTITTDSTDAVTCSVRVNIEEDNTYGAASTTFDITTSRPYYVGGSSWNNENISAPLQNKDILPVNTAYTRKSGQCTVDVSGDVTITGAGVCTITIDTPTDNPVDLTIETAKGTLITTNPAYDSPILATATATNPTTEASTIPEYTGAITYSTSTDTICSVDATSGAVTPKIIGTCTITASFASDINWNEKELTPVDITVNGATNVVVFSYQQTSHVGGTQEITPTITINSQDLATTKATRTVTFSELGDDLDANACTVNAETGVITITGTLDSENLDCSVEVSIGSHTRYLESTQNATLQISKVAKTPTVVAFSYPLEYRLGTTTSTTPIVTIKDGDDPARTFDSVSETRTVAFSEVANSDTNNYCEVDTNTGVVTVTADVDDEVSCVFSVSVDETDSQTSVNLSTTIATSRPYYVGGSSWNNTPIVVELQNKDILPVNTTYTHKSGQCTVDASGDASITGAGICTVTIDTPTDDPIDLTIETAKGTLIITNPVYLQTLPVNAGETNLTTEASTIPEYTGARTYGTNTTDVCSVDATSGAVTPKIIGTCTITASFSTDINWNANESAESSINITRADNVVNFTYPGITHTGGTQTVSPTITINSEDLATTSRTVTFSEVANTDTNNYCTVDSSTGVVTVTGTITEIAVTCEVEVSIDLDGRYLASTHQTTLNISGLSTDFSGDGVANTTDSILFYAYALYTSIGFSRNNIENILEILLEKELDYFSPGTPRLSDSKEDVYALLDNYAKTNATDFSGDGVTNTTDSILFYAYALYTSIGFSRNNIENILEILLEKELDYFSPGTPRLSDSKEDAYELMDRASR